MAKQPPKPEHDRMNTSESGLRRHLHELKKNDRGQASQLDFLFSMTIRMVAITMFLAVSAALVYGMIGPNYTDKMVADRAADRLADDYLVDTPNDALLERECTKAFFAKTTPGECGFKDSWTNVDQPEEYLNAALFVDEKRQINVTIENTAGSIASLDETKLALGETPPRDHSTVYNFHRQVGLDGNNDGAYEWYTLRVQVW
ncbi:MULTISPECIES: hypothetical protein [unclassified Haloferax]|uniref:DUF7287 family protein n=1 Tax=unclassified Haloferax TaxID=2625095 RepID=UPI002874A0E9|nr:MULTISPECIES: hypothetical protein [unclassified Haloferax]MDS0243145.1 hypothetical protein [Haloferax sp. S2CR25]MDS0446266.1 hypothetical protein [Haloferax sp. S2CR25-2]